jgi:hypothetical protein
MRAFIVLPSVTDTASVTFVLPVQCVHAVHAVHVSAITCERDCRMERNFATPCTFWRNLIVIVKFLVTFRNDNIVCGISCLEREVEMDAKAIIWMSVCGIIVALVILGSSLDCFWYQPKLLEAKSSGGNVALGKAFCRLPFASITKFLVILK